MSNKTQFQDWKKKEEIEDLHEQIAHFKEVGDENDKYVVCD